MCPKGTGPSWPRCFSLRSCFSTFEALRSLWVVYRKVSVCWVWTAEVGHCRAPMCRLCNGEKPRLRGMGLVGGMVPGLDGVENY